MSSSGERNFLQERSVAEIVKNAFWIYGVYFRKIFPSYFVLVFPAYVLGFIALIALVEPFGLGSVIYLILIISASTVASVVITFVVSDICLGEAPNLRRAWKHLSAGLLGKLLVTNILFYLLIFLCCVVLIVMALVVSLLMPSWFVLLFWPAAALLFIALLTCLVFIPTIVILENRWGFKAIKRSVTLGYGFHFRNLIVVCLMLAFVTVGPLALSFWFSSTPVGEVIGALLYYLVCCLTQPLGLIYIVLMYYDIRVRKESYDNAALAEDLRH